MSRRPNNGDKDKERRKKWIAAVQRNRWNPSSRSKLCSEHFEDQCFSLTVSSRWLKSDAVPTIFEFPLHIRRPLKARRKHREARDVQPAAEICADAASPASQDIPPDITRLDHPYCALENSDWLLGKVQSKNLQICDLMRENEELRQQYNLIEPALKIYKREKRRVVARIKGLVAKNVLLMTLQL
eukprot:snap_masked-scaffold776_size99073-processed-gene-0.8 protein:Tk00565 transcript:snap_masked-scaffold776_size99073-processed-gene-0.8-mRNA-1 annotation:"thap domain-containing protein 2"